MVGLFLINNTSIPIQIRQKISLFYRLFCGFLGGAIFFIYINFYQKNFLLGLFCFILWGLSLYSGKYLMRIRHRIIRKKKIEKRNSWTSSFFLASLIIPIVFYIEEKVDIIILYIFTLAINYAYLGSKVVCSISKCCGVHFTLKGNSKFKLQKREFYVTYTILLIGLCFLFSNTFNKVFTASILLLFHGLLRWYAAKYRFPYRSIWSFIKDFSVSYIILFSLICLSTLIIFG